MVIPFRAPKAGSPLAVECNVLLLRRDQALVGILGIVCLLDAIFRVPPGVP